MVKQVAEPVVVPPYYVRRFLGQILSPTIIRELVSSLPKVPPVFKAVFWILIVANIKAFPLLWHVRVFAAAIIARSVARPSIHPLLPRIRSSKNATTSPGITPRLRLDKLPLGKDIFGDRSVTKFRALPDDCDWNGHMSNSSYSKNLDFVRIDFLATRFLRFHFDGGHFALGGTSIIWHAEVPFMAKYEIEMNIVAWDDKWLYIVGRFMSPSSRDDQAHGMSKRSKSAQNLKALMSDVIRPQGEAVHASKAKGGQIRSYDPENTNFGPKRTLYCTSVSRYCFKSGRKTIPPWFVIVTSGYGAYASTRTNWDKAENLRRNVLAKTKAQYQEETGKPLPRDALVLGSGYRKGGILSHYDPGRKEGDIQNTQGLGAWQDRKNWHTTEFEERRQRGLDAVRLLGGFANPNLVDVSNSVASLHLDV